MSADYRTGRFKGYAHTGPSGEVAWVHVTHAAGGDAMGSFALTDITALAELAGRAWPSGPGVQVRWVIEARRPGQLDWRVMWSAPDGDLEDLGGVDEDYARTVYAQFAKTPMEWRLVHRVTVTADEVITVEDTGRAPQ
jgi:hypothetical protein